MRHDSCPHCHTRSGLEKFYTLVFTLTEWPLVFLYGLVVFAFGEKFHHSIELTSFFAFLAVIPLLIKVIEKQGCSNCGMESRTKSAVDRVEI
jgi:hypothetical protein